MIGIDEAAALIVLRAMLHRAELVAAGQLAIVGAAFVALQLVR